MRGQWYCIPFIVRNCIHTSIGVCAVCIFTYCLCIYTHMCASSLFHILLMHARVCTYFLGCFSGLFVLFRQFDVKKCIVIVMSLIYIIRIQYLRPFLYITIPIYTTMYCTILFEIITYNGYKQMLCSDEIIYLSVAMYSDICFNSNVPS